METAVLCGFGSMLLKDPITHSYVINSTVTKAKAPKPGGWFRKAGQDQDAQEQSVNRPPELEPEPEPEPEPGAPSCLKQKALIQMLEATLTRVANAQSKIEVTKEEVILLLQWSIQ